jgi:type II secretory pathway component HofQ
MMENKFQVAINAGGAGSGPRPPPPTRATAAAAVDWHLPCAQDKKRITRSHQAANLRKRRSRDPQSTKYNLGNVASALNSLNLLNDFFKKGNNFYRTFGQLKRSICLSYF